MNERQPRISGESTLPISEAETMEMTISIDDVQLEMHRHSREGGEISLAPAPLKQILAPNGQWNEQGISVLGEKSLNADQKQLFLSTLHESIVPIAPGGQESCMDGRIKQGYDDSNIDHFIQPLGPKSAGGTVGNAIRLMVASHAYSPSKPMSYEEALFTVTDSRTSEGLQPGGHELSQCGAWAHAKPAIDFIAKNPEQVETSVGTFIGAVGLDYSDKVQKDIALASQKISANLDRALLPTDQTAYKTEATNKGAFPVLINSHAEKALLVIMKPGVTLHTNHFASRVSEKLGFDAQAFGYNWEGGHVEIAKKLSGGLADYYLQSVPSQDVPVLQRLTDGSLDLAFYK